MRFLPAFTLLLPATSAFYIYQPKPIDPNKLRKKLSPRDASTEPSTPFTLPLRRVPVRRANQYDIIKGKQPTQSESQAINHDNTDYTYMVSVKFGSSLTVVDYNMLIDSGAADSWVMGATCLTDACKAHNTLGAADSKSLAVGDQPFSVTYGTGSVQGSLARDSITLKSFVFPMSFGLVQNASDEFLDYPMDGLLGFGRTEPGDIGTSSLIDVLKKAGMITNRLYGIWLPRASDGLNDGEVNFNEPNKGRYDGDLNFNKAVSPSGIWEIPVADAGVDGKKQGLTGRTALIDTGTSFILLPPDDATRVMSQITGATQSGELFTVPCNTQQIIQLTFNGVAYSIPPKDYLAAPLDSSKKTCSTNIIGRQTFGPKQWLVGTPFLKNVYTVFDFDNSQIGFGTKGVAVADSKASDPAPSATSAPSAPKGSSMSAIPSVTAQPANPSAPIPPPTPAASSPAAPVPTTQGSSQSPKDLFISPAAPTSSVDLATVLFTDIPSLSIPTSGSEQESILTTTTTTTTSVGTSDTAQTTDSPSATGMATVASTATNVPASAQESGAAEASPTQEGVAPRARLNVLGALLGAISVSFFAILA